MSLSENRFICLTPSFYSNAYSLDIPLQERYLD